jgi:branched-chain amino acid transport system ATP-binding protein
MAQPKLLLLDEPLLGLSPAIQYLLAKSIKEIRDQRGMSIIVAEQYARPIIPIIDYGYILENGAAVVDGGRQELMDNPDVKSAYFGT